MTAGRAFCAGLFLASLAAGAQTNSAQGEFYKHQAVELSVIPRLKEAYRRLQFAYTAIDLLTRNRDLLSKLRRITEAPYFISQSAQQAQVAALDARILKFQLEKRGREAEINKLLKRPFNSQVPRPSTLKPPKLEASLDELVARAHLSASVLRRDNQSAYQSLLYEIKEQYLNADTASRLMAAYADSVIPEANRALQAYRAAYEAGAVDFMSVQQSFMSAVEFELSYYQERLNLSLALIRLEELTGLSLVD